MDLNKSKIQELVSKAADELEALQEDDQSAKELAKYLEYHELTNFIKKEYKVLLLEEPNFGICNTELVDSFEKNNIDSFDKFINLYFEKNINNETDNLQWLQMHYESIVHYIWLWKLALEVDELQKQLDN